jgi:arylsulfatase A-like enzyme
MEQTLSQPNILFIQSDQHRYDCLGAHGHPLIQTPHLDRLAAEGTTFSHAFTPVPVCVPARNSLMYGRWPTGHLSIANWDTEAPRPAVEGLTAYTEVLQEAGYRLAHVGKWQVHPQKGPQAYGFSESVPVSAYAEWRAEQGLPLPDRSNWFGGLDSHITPAQSRMAWQADAILEIVDRWAGDPRPFYIQWDLREPHLPNILPEPYCSMYDPQTIEPWPSYPDPLISKPYAQAQQRRTWQVATWTWEDWAPVVARYLGTITLLDAQIGRLLDGLDHLGLADETMVVYTTDHGDMCGGHGMVDKHMVMYDDVTRVPLIVRWPGRAQAGRTCDAFVSHALDLAATFCLVAGGSVPDSYDGASLLPLLHGDQANRRSDILSMYHGNQFGLFSERMVRDRRFKYVWNAAAEDELYDLALDPGERRNLATDPSSVQELTRLRRRLVDWMEAVDDPLLNGWTRTQLLKGLSI